MELQEAKIRFDAGDLQYAKVMNAEMLQGWTVYMDGKSGVNYRLESARNTMRVFKTLDAAVRVLQDIGFRHVEVML